MPGPIEVGIVLREQHLSAWSGRLDELAERAVAAGVDHLTVGDHVIFANGHGADGLIQAGALLTAHSSCTAPSAPRPRRRSRSWWAAARTRALGRVGQLGDGWLALWVSPRRFTEAMHRIDAAAAEAGRAEVSWHHALQLWAGFDTSPARAKKRLAAAMAAAYAVPFERFERYAACGPPAAVAEALAPYLALGCRTFNFVPEAESLPAAFEATAEVKAVLSGARR